MSNSISELFIKEALKTESPITPELINRLTEERTIRLLHAAMGMTTEAVEFLDAMKKFIFYGKDLDLVNIAEELGDSDWYKAIAHDELGRSFEEIWAMVIKKLQMRYKGSFNVEGAINRDLNAERNILEKDCFYHYKLSQDVACGYSPATLVTYNPRKVTCMDCIKAIKVNYGLNKEDTNPMHPEEAGTIFKDDQLEIKIFDQPVIHWLSDVDRFFVLCTGQKLNMESVDKFTLDKLLVNCQNCIALLQNGSDF